jgi:hypothetical protein
MEFFISQNKSDLPLDVPDKLYHATYKSLMNSIRSKGLGGHNTTNWEDSVSGVLYLAKNPDTAFSYAETSDIGWDLYAEDDGLYVVVLEIDASQLDPDKFKHDSNVLDSDDTLEYHGLIPFRFIKVYKTETA